MRSQMRFLPAGRNLKRMSWRVADNVLAYCLENGIGGEIA
jgi:hypothetical protein